MTIETFGNAFGQQLAEESWSLYSVGMALIFLRMYARMHLRGIKHLQPDDFIMIWAAVLYTTLIVCLNLIADGGGSNLYPPGQFETFTPEDIRERIQGSKIVVVSEQAMLNVIYALKACILVFYSRLTTGLAQQRMVKGLAVAVACGWVASELAFFFACRPFNGYWAVPPPNPQCTTLQHYAITQGCFNITTDICMLLISLPLVFKLALPWRQKLVLMLIFSMGSFVIIAALLTKIFNLTNQWSSVYMLWYVRESSVAVYVANLPMIWPLLREWFPFLRKFNSSGKGSRNYTAGTTMGRTKRTTIGGGTHGGTIDQNTTTCEAVEMENKTPYTVYETDIEKASQSSGEMGHNSDGVINKKTTVTVREERAPSIDRTSADGIWQH